MKGQPALVGDGMTTEPGEADYFPGVDASIAPVEETINGTIVVDGAVSTRGLVSAPVACRLEKGIITAIEGGADATAAKGEKVTPEYAKAHREGFQKALKTGVKTACGGDPNPAG